MAEAADGAVAQKRSGDPLPAPIFQRAKVGGGGAAAGGGAGEGFDITEAFDIKAALANISSTLVADRSGPAVSASDLATEILLELARLDAMPDDYTYNTAAFADRLHQHGLSIRTFSTWTLPDNFYMVPIGDLRSKTHSEIAALLVDMSPLAAYEKADRQLALTGTASNLVSNLMRPVDFDGSRKQIRNIRTEDVVSAQPPGPVQRSANGIFRSPESEKLASGVGLRKALRDSGAAVIILQGTLGAACLEQVIAAERGRVEPVPTVLLREHGVHPNQTNFSSAGAVDENFGIKFAQVPGHAPKLIISVESIGWALSVYNDERADALACYMACIQFVRSVGKAKPLANDNLLRFVVQAIPGGGSKELTDAANEAFGLRDDDGFVSPAVQRMAAMDARPPPAGAAKKADGSVPKSAADAMRSKGGTNQMAAMAARPPPAGAAKKADGSVPKSAADAMRSKGGKNAKGGAPLGNQNSKGHQNAKGRRTGVRKCGICGKEGHYTKTCSKSKAITSFFDPA
jgi:hypothetical protein